MVRANCRARFTAADFDFIVRTLARSQSDQVSLVDLLSDVDTRDSILDHPRLVDAILNHCGRLRISSQFYFYVLARHVLQQGGIGDRKLCDYVASLLETFSRASRLQICDETHHLAEQYISDMLIALNRATLEQALLLRAHIGNYSLFISGICHSAVAVHGGRLRRCAAVAPVGRQGAAPIGRARAHCPAPSGRPALRWHLLFARAHRAVEATRSARGFGRSQYPVADHVRRGTQSCAPCCASVQKGN